MNERYFVGRGYWHDKRNWADQSGGFGGFGGFSIPDEYTNVIFDHNSGECIIGYRTWFQKLFYYIKNIGALYYNESPLAVRCNHFTHTSGKDVHLQVTMYCSGSVTIGNLSSTSGSGRLILTGNSSIYKSINQKKYKLN